MYVRPPFTPGPEKSRGKTCQSKSIKANQNMSSHIQSEGVTHKWTFSEICKALSFLAYKHVKAQYHDIGPSAAWFKYDLLLHGQSNTVNHSESKNTPEMQQWRLFPLRETIGDCSDAYIGTQSVTKQGEVGQHFVMTAQHDEFPRDTRNTFNRVTT